MTKIIQIELRLIIFRKTDLNGHLSMAGHSILICAFAQKTIPPAPHPHLPSTVQILAYPLDCSSSHQSVSVDLPLYPLKIAFCISVRIYPAFYSNQLPPSVCLLLEDKPLGGRKFVLFNYCLIIESNFILLWLENMVSIFILWNLLRLALWPGTGTIFVNVLFMLGNMG